MLIILAVQAHLVNFFAHFAHFFEKKVVIQNVMWFHNYMDGGGPIGNRREMMQYTDRKFGIEIEFVGARRDEVARRLRDAGIDAQSEGYNHRTTSYWKIVSDSSLHHRSGMTGELVSPILQGADGFAQLETVCRVLNQIGGCTVNRTCGLHVHLDCRDMTAPQIATVWERYATYEQQIDMVMPQSRRGQAHWCRSVVDHKHQMKQFNTKESQAYAMGRYYKVNLTNIATRGAMEFRQHSGTTEYRKIANWVCFLMQFVETSIQLTEQAQSAPIKKRAFNEIRNLFENNDMSITWKRGSDTWVVRKSSTNRVLGTISTQALRNMYVTNKKSHIHSLNDTTDNIFENTAFSAVCSFTDEVVQMNYSNAVHAEPVTDTGWMHGVEQCVQDYFDERYEELN